MIETGGTIWRPGQGPLNPDREGGAVQRPTRERKLPRPPSVVARREFPAVIEPALRDIPENLEPEIESGFKVVEGERHDLAAEGRLVGAARDVALADERVQSVLGDGRFAVIGVSRRLDDKERREALTVLVAYRYGDGRAVEVTLSGDEELRVADVQEVDYQPPPSDEELERAIALARGGRGVAELLADGWEATVILTSDVEVGDRHYGRRRFIVGFGPADERQPRLRALVDLGSERTIAVDVASVERNGEEEVSR
jgi:hypothetical protein